MRTLLAIIMLLGVMPARGADLGPAMAIAGPDATGATVTLHAGPGPCVDGAMAAVWRPADRSRSVLGCWRPVPGGVIVAFLDADRADIPDDRLVKVKDS